MGGGENIFMDRSEQEDEQRLREVVCKWRSVRVRCHESPHAEAIGSHLRLFHTVSLGTSVNKGKKRKDRARRRRSGVLVENKDSGPPFGQDESLLL
jgi:hypothetical protein